MELTEDEIIQKYAKILSCHTNMNGLAFHADTT